MEGCGDEGSDGARVSGVDAEILFEDVGTGVCDLVVDRLPFGLAHVRKNENGNFLSPVNSERNLVEVFLDTATELEIVACHDEDDGILGGVVGEREQGRLMVEPPRLDLIEHRLRIEM